MRDWVVVLIVAVAALAGPARAQEVRDVAGRVVASDSTALQGVWISVLIPGGDSAVSDVDGQFVLRGVPRRPVQLAIRAIWVVPDTLSLAADRDSITIRARMQVIALPALEVVGERQPLARQRFERTAQISTTSLDPTEVARAPGLFEPDVVRAVQLLPGAVAKNDFTTTYNVRGGEADQNLVTLDGLPVFNPSHLGGLFSTFDANAVERADFYAGGFPAWYPGRLSSVLDISLREGDPLGFRGSGQVSLLSSKLLLEGPIAGADYLLGVRRTYADAVVATFTRHELPYYFTDAVAKVATHPGGDGTLSVTGYWGRDLFDIDLVRPTEDRDGIRLGFDWGNRLLGVMWREPVRRRGFVEARAGVTEFSTTLGLLPSLIRLHNGVRLGTAQVAVALDTSGVHDLRFGASVEAYGMDYEATSEALESTLFEARYRPTVLAGFVNDQWQISNALMLRPGLRVEHVTGADHTSLSPRVAAKWFLDRRTALTGSLGRYYQAIHSIRDQELPITVFEAWIGADRFVPVARSDHLVLGVERWFGDAIQFWVEGYRKTYDNLVTPNRAQDLRVEGDEFIPARGTSWGLDLLLRKHAGTLRGWIAYSFTRARRVAGEREYPPAHDRRHTVNVVAFLPGPLGSDLGLRWGYGSPLPYTGIVGQWEHRSYNATDHAFDDSFEEPFSSSVNGERYPPYSRLDVSLRWDMERWGVRWQPYLQVANVYNRRNVFLYFFEYDQSPPRRTGVSQLPLLPTFGLEVAF